MSKANQFKQARTQANLTQEQLAVKAQVSSPIIISIEAGKYGNISTLEKVAKALKKKVTVILE